MGADSCMVKNLHTCTHYVHVNLTQINRENTLSLLAGSPTSPPIEYFLSFPELIMILIYHPRLILPVLEFLIY